MRKSSCPNLLRTWRHSQQGLTWPMVLASSACRERNSVSPWPFLDSMVILDSNQTNKKWGNVVLKHLCQVWAIRLILNSSGKIHPWIRISALALILVLMCSLSCWGCTGVYIIYIYIYPGIATSSKRTLTSKNPTKSKPAELKTDIINTSSRTWWLGVLCRRCWSPRHLCSSRSFAFVQFSKAGMYIAGSTGPEHGRTSSNYTKNNPNNGDVLSEKDVFAAVLIRTSAH